MINIAREGFSDETFDEVMPLAQKCWDESTTFKGETCAYHGDRDFKIEPSKEGYQQLEKNGCLVLITLRDDGVLKGYIVGFTYYSLHHGKILCGIGDTMYIEPECRFYTRSMAKRFEKEMRAMGAQIIGWPVHINGPVYEVLKVLGYVGDDIVMEKRLKL